MEKLIFKIWKRSFEDLKEIFKADVFDSGDRILATATDIDKASGDYDFIKLHFDSWDEYHQFSDYLALNIDPSLENDKATNILENLYNYN